MKLKIPSADCNDQKAFEFLRIILRILPFALFLPHWLTSAFVVAAAVGVLRIRRLRARLLKHSGSVITFGFLLLTSVVAAINLNYIGFVRTLVFAAAVCIVFASRSMMTGALFEAVLDRTVMGGCAATLVSVVEMIIHIKKPGYRAQSFFTNPNFFGVAIAFVILICVYKIANKKNGETFYFVAAVMCAVGLFLCGSMSLWVVIFLGAVLILSFSRNYRLLAILLSVAAAVVCLVLLVPHLVPRLEEVSLTIYNRKLIWGFALDNIKKSPLFGHGFYSYKYLYNMMKDTQYIYPASLAHNVVLDSLLCHGVVGTAILTVAFVQYYRSCFSCRKKRKALGERSPIFEFIIAMSITVGFYGLIDTTFVWIQTGTIILLIYAGIGAEENELKTLCDGKIE